MSLNRYEQMMFDYWDRNTDERRHWQTKVADLMLVSNSAGDQARSLERELWDYLVERSQHVPVLRDLRLEGVRRVSLLNLAEHIIRLWGPPPKPRRPASTR